MNKREEHLSTADFVATGRDERNEEMRRRQEQPEATHTAGGGGAAMEPEAGPLLPENTAGEMRSRWDEIQTGFVDEPRAAVRQADELVAMAMKRLAEGFSHERENLERQWDRGDQVNTEDLRQAFRKYRSFFHRLLSV